MIGQVMLSEFQSDGFEMDITDLPSAAAIIPYMSDSTAYVARVDGGIRSVSHGPPLIGNVAASIPAMAPAIVFLGSMSNRRFENVVEAAAVVEE